MPGHRDGQPFEDHAQLDLLIVCPADLPTHVSIDLLTRRPADSLIR
jgi:hypothetical protein